jgi:competence ComEA-like helix-hairpin-helix protein
MKKPFVIFSKRLERGTMLWLCVCVVVIFAPRIEAYFVNPDLSYTWQYKMHQKALRAFQMPSKSTTRRSYSRLWKRCNPASLTSSDWQRLGLSPKQAASLLRYKDKYGLHSLSQMQHIRVLPSELIDQISDSLCFEPTPNTRISVVEQEEKVLLDKRQEAKGQFSKLDINLATEAMLVALPGLGAYTASKIIAYRERLGGFLALDQLQEIQGIRPEILQKVLPYLVLEQGVKRMSINEVSYETLKQHPYLTWNQANSIIKMRKQKGAFKEIKELKESVLIDDDTYKKLLPYVSL